MRVTAIIPAYNEEKNIVKVIRPLNQCPALSDIIVVDDGSTDATASVAHHEGVRVIRQKNTGKAGAMLAGAKATMAGILFFSDADLVGFTAEHCEKVVAPVAQGRAGMTVGIRGWGTMPMWVMKNIMPVIGGERAILKSHFLKLCAHPMARRYGIETVMNAYCRRHRIPVILIRMPGVSIIRKEQKVGFAQGFSERLSMFMQILKTEIALLFDRTL